MREAEKNRVKMIKEERLWARYLAQYVGCLILSRDHQIILQKRGEDWDHYPGYTCEFGGHLEKGESSVQALQRELREELGAKVAVNDAIFLGALTEVESKHGELIHVYFWHDKSGSITGCYEGEMVRFDNASSALSTHKITSGLRWLIIACRRRGFIT